MEHSIDNNLLVEELNLASTQGARVRVASRTEKHRFHGVTVINFPPNYPRGNRRGTLLVAPHAPPASQITMRECRLNDEA